MNTSFGKWAFTVVLILLGAGWVAGIVAVLQAMGNTSLPINAQAAGAAPTPSAPSLPSKHVFLALQTFPSTPTDAWMKERHCSFVSPGLPPNERPPSPRGARC